MLIETFGECLQSWMKETSRSIAFVAAEAGLKSKTTVVRILQGESSYQSCVRFYEALSSHHQMEEKWKMRFADSLRVEKIGLHEFALFEVFRQYFCDEPESLLFRYSGEADTNPRTSSPDDNHPKI